ncbi:MAG: tetratricopeptide repeat protein [Chloroflexota bacterium]
MVIAPPPTPMVFHPPTSEGGIPATDETDSAAIPTADVSLESAELSSSATIPAGATGSDLLEIGERLLGEGDFSGAAAAYREATSRETELSADELASARYGMGVALLEDNQPDLAAQALDPLLSTEDSVPTDLSASASFQRGQATAGRRCSSRSHRGIRGVSSGKTRIWGPMSSR